MDKRKKSTLAVSEVLGTILLLGISVSLFSVVYVSFFTIQPEPSSPTTYLVGSIRNDELFLEHMGGEDLDLETRILLSFNDGTTTEIYANQNDYLTNQYKQDNKWNIGEELYYPLSNENSFLPFDPVDVTVVDQKSNSVIMSGKVKEANKADLVVSYEIDYVYQHPQLHPDDTSPIIFFLNVENTGPSDTEDVEVEMYIPEGVQYVTIPDTSYNPQTRICTLNVGDISAGETKTFEIPLDIYMLEEEEMEFTQLILLIDGSQSCSIAQFDAILSGIKNAVLNILPHNGLIELTLIQYGQEGLGSSRLEIGTPTVLTEQNYQTVANQIDSIHITKMNDHTPMDSAFLRAGNTFSGLASYDPSHKQSVLVFAAGLPDAYIAPEDEPGYRATRPYRDDVAYEWGKVAAYARRDEMITKLTMNSEQDEINSLLILNPVTLNYQDNPWQDPSNISWIKNKIAWPGSSYIGPEDKWPPQNGPGWVRGISNTEELANSILEIFSIETETRIISVELSNSKYIDPDLSNNIFELIIDPL